MPEIFIFDKTVVFKPKIKMHVLINNINEIKH